MANDTYMVGLSQAPEGGATGTITARMSQLKNLCVSISEEAGHDLTREGCRFILGVVGAITGIAPIQTLGAQVAAFGLSNTSTTKTMFVDAIGMVLESGTAGATGNQVSVTHFTAPAQAGTYAGLGVVNANGGTTASTALATGSSVTITNPAASVWWPVANSIDAASVAVGSLAIINNDVRGRIAIQPGKSLGIHVTGAAGTSPLFAPFMSWTEETSDCG
jgi:hypothetical protein